MATYEYLCKTCGQLKEFTFPIGEQKDSVPCDCSTGKNMYRYYSSPAITFNGPGFYKTGG